MRPSRRLTQARRRDSESIWCDIAGIRYQRLKEAKEEIARLTKERDQATREKRYTELRDAMLALADANTEPGRAKLLHPNLIREIVARVERGGAEPDSHFWCVKHKSYDAYADGTCASVERGES